VKVEKDEIGGASRDERQQLRTRSGLADDVDVVRRLERSANALQHERVIVRYEDLQ
jgi:hypothetical protein